MTQLAPTPLTQASQAFLRALEGKNRSSQTIKAYRIDLTQFITFLQRENPLLLDPTEVLPEDVHEYLAHLAQRGLSGVSRRRKVAALREFFRHLKQIKALSES